MKHEVSSLRLPEPMAKQLRSIAQADGVSVAEVLREAIEDHITARVSKEEFKERLEKRLEEDREVLDRLAENDRGARWRSCRWRGRRRWRRRRGR